MLHGNFVAKLEPVVNGLVNFLKYFPYFICVLYKISLRTPMTCWKFTKFSPSSRQTHFQPLRAIKLAPRE